MGFFDKIKQKLTNLNVSDKTNETPIEQIEVENKLNETSVTANQNATPTENIAIEQVSENKVNIESINETMIELQEDIPVVQIVETPIQNITEPINNTPQEDKIEKEPEAKKSFFSKVSSAIKSTFGVEKIKEGLTKTRKTFSDNLRKVLGTGRKIDENLLAEIEELLITADIGVDTTEQIIEALRQRVKKEN